MKFLVENIENKIKLSITNNHTAVLDFFRSFKNGNSMESSYNNDDWLAKYNKIETKLQKLIKEDDNIQQQILSMNEKTIALSVEVKTINVRF